MHTTTHTTQVLTMFGSGYVAEQHADASHYNLAPKDVGHSVALLRGAMLAEILKSLRSTLSLH